MKQPMKQPMDHPWRSAGVVTTARAWTWRACAVAALWCGLYVVVLLPALVVYTVVCTFLDAVAAVVSRTPAPAPAPLRRDAHTTQVVALHEVLDHAELPEDPRTGAGKHELLSLIHI